ncbi:MAG: DUF1491 family protein [Alphaproteobacteria bacterium]
MRLKASIWVSAYVRRLNAMPPVAAVVARRGDEDAGAIFIKINTLDGYARVWRPAPTGLDTASDERTWMDAFPGKRISDADAEGYLVRQADFDDDMWVVEVEDREGRHFLDAHLLQENI